MLGVGLIHPVDPERRQDMARKSGSKSETLNSFDVCFCLSLHIVYPDSLLDQHLVSIVSRVDGHQTRIAPVVPLYDS